MREGSLEAPVRHPLDWQNPWFWDEKALEKEMERVFDICHGCRRCFNLCDSFPRLFDLIDTGPTGELDGVKKEDYGRVEAACTLCDGLSVVATAVRTAAGSSRTYAVSALPAIGRMVSPVSMSSLLLVPPAHVLSAEPVTGSTEG